MSHQDLLALFARGERVHREAIEEIALSRRLVAQSEVLLQCMHDGLTAFSEIESRQRDPRLKHP